MGSGVCLRRCAMRTVAGECGDESRSATCFKGAQTRDMHVLVARSACSGCALSAWVERKRSPDRTDERGHVCVQCMVLCVDLLDPCGQCVSHITCRDGRPVPGPKKVDSYNTNFYFAFWTVCRGRVPNLGVTRAEPMSDCTLRSCFFTEKPKTASQVTDRALTVTLARVQQGSLWRHALWTGCAKTHLASCVIIHYMAHER